MNWFIMAGLEPSGLFSSSSTRKDCKMVSLAKLNTLMNIDPITRPSRTPTTHGVIQLPASPVY